MGRQTRSQGPAKDPELAPGEFWLRTQVGAKKDRVKGTPLPVGPGGAGFVTLNIPTHKFRALSLRSTSVATGSPSVAGAFVSLQTTPPKQTGAEVDGRKDSVADSAVDLKTPTPSFPTLNTAAGQTPVARLGEGGSAGISSPERPNFSPITPPRLETLLSFLQTSEPQYSASVEPIVERGLDQSSNDGRTEASVGANDPRTPFEPVTSIQESRSYPSNFIQAPEPAPNSQQLHCSFEPSPKTHTPDLHLEASTADTTTDSNTNSAQIGQPVPLIADPAVQPSSLSLDEGGTVENPKTNTTQPAFIPATPRPVSFAAPSEYSAPASHPQQRLPSPQKQSHSKRDHSVTPDSAEQEVPAKRKPGRPKKDPRKPSLVVNLPIKEGFILTEDMAPVRDLQDVSGKLKDAIQDMFDVTQTVVGFVPESQELLIDRMAQLSQNLAHLQNMTDSNKSPNNPVHNIHIAPEVVDYTDDGRNPDIFSRDFVELVQRGNAVMNGKKQAFNSFAEIYARELKKGIGGVDKQVDAVMKNAGLELKDETKADEGKPAENGEKSG